jgi:hypothetical protein
MSPKDNYTVFLKCPSCKKIGLACWSMCAKPAAPSTSKRKLDSLAEGFKKVLVQDQPEGVLIVCANCNVGVV